MSSSHLNAISDKFKDFNRIDERLYKCPECGAKTMIRVRSDCLLQDGTFVPDLERWQCAECKANFFDSKAMDTIRQARYSKRRTPVSV